jgi:Carboxylesterase family
VRLLPRDVTLEALTDGLYVAPVVETADYHASLNKNSWLYVFDYQSKYGDFMQVKNWVNFWLLFINFSCINVFLTQLAI